MWVWDVLADHIPGLLFYLCFLANNFDAPTTRQSGWLHYIHVLVTINFAVCLEASVVIRDDVGFGAEIEISRLAFHSLNVFPHQVFATNLERLRKMIDSLVLCGVFQVVISDYTGPHHVPLWCIRWHNPYACCFKNIHYWVVHVGRFCHFEAQRHSVVFEVLLIGCFNFLEVTQITCPTPILHLHERDSLFHLSWHGLDLNSLDYQLSLRRLLSVVFEAVFRV